MQCFYLTGIGMCSLFWASWIGYINYRIGTAYEEKHGTMMPMAHMEKNNWLYVLWQKNLLKYLLMFIFAWPVGVLYLLIKLGDNKWQRR